MNLIGERIISYLKTDSTLQTLLGGANLIFAMAVPDRKDKYIVVSTEPGKDLNNIPAQEGEFTVECIVSRKVANAHKTCIDLARRVDDILNKSENMISTDGWDILHLLRVGSPTNGLMIDGDTQQFVYALEFEYLLGETS